MRNKKYLLVAMVVLLVISMIAVIAACDPDDPGSDDKSYSNTLIGNGNFDSASGENYPLTPSNWTGAPGSDSSSATYKTPSGSDNLAAGVLNINDERKYRSAFGSVTPGKTGEDDNVLAIYNKTATAYKYTSDSVTLEADSVYKLSVWVKTQIYTDETYYSDWTAKGKTVDNNYTGAYVYVNGIAYAGFEGINTSGEWQEIVAYINTQGASSGTITVTLSLGTGNYDSGHMVAGYAFFDNITLVNLNEEYADSDSTFVKGDNANSEEKAAELAQQNFAAAVAGTSESNIVNGVATDASHKVHTYKYHAGIGDAQFDYVTTTSTPYTPSKWTGQAGKKTDGTSFGTSSSYLQKGVLNAASGISVIDNNASYSGLTLDAQSRTHYVYSGEQTRTLQNVLYIQTKQAGAYGYRSSSSFTVEANTCYRISVWVKSYVKDGDGASVKLTYGDENTELCAVNKINNSAWTEYVLYVQGNQYRDNTVKFELWMGESDTAGTTGIAFFDNVSVKKISTEEYNNAQADDVTAKGDLLSSDENMTYYTVGDGSLVYSADAANTSSDANVRIARTGEVIDGITMDKALSDKGGDTVIYIGNKVPTRAAVAPVIIKNNGDGTFDENDVVTSNLITLPANGYLSVSVWVKTSDIIQGGLGVTLYSYDIKGIKKDITDYLDKEADDYKDLTSFKKSVGSLTSLTSEGLKDFAISGVNDYVMLTFAVEGGNEDAYLGLEFVLGSGTATNSSSYVKGYAMISNIMTEKITAATYASTTKATNVTTGNVKNSAGENEISSNGYFNISDVSATDTLYKKTDENYNFNSDSNTVLALPKSWNASDSALLGNYIASDKGTTYAFGGVLNINNAKDIANYKTAIGTDAQNISALLDNKDNFYATADKYSGLNVNDYSNVLALYSHQAAMFGFSSSSVSLSAQSYYRISVWVYTEPGTQVSIILSTGSDDNDYGFIAQTPVPVDASGTAGWKQYALYVETGVSSVSATMSLYLGTPRYEGENVSSFNYAALFTGATYQTITAEDYKAATANSKANKQALSMLVDGMDNVTESETSLHASSSWTGSQIDSEASADDVTAGVFDRDKHNWEDLLDLQIDLGDADEALLTALYNDTVKDVNINNPAITTGIGDNVLVIYNHDDVLDDENNLAGGAYSFKSADMTLSAGNYYKITVWVLTYKLKETDSVIVKLTIGNSTYTFGADIDDESSAVDKARRINTSSYADGKETVGSWKEVSFYVYVDENVTSSATATLTLQLGEKDKWVSGYAFFDNFSCVQVSPVDVEGTENDKTPAQVISTKLGFDVNYTDEANSDNNDVFSDKNAYGADGVPGAVLSNNYIVHYTQADAEKAPEEETPADDDNKNDLLWLYIVSGIIGGLIVIAVIVVIARKVLSKRKRQKQVSKKSDFDRNYGNKSNIRNK